MVSIAELKNSLVDGTTPLNKELFVRIIDTLSAEKSSGLPYCDFHHNLGVIGEFLAKYELKEVDEFNQLTICMAGDSIFGRVDKKSKWATSPEMTYTPDVNAPDETRYGYQTGHFPPNMWEQTVPYKMLQLLQWNNADVKYFNHVAEEITLDGTWVDAFPVEPDCLRIVRTNEQGANIVFTFSNATHMKALFPTYGAVSSFGSQFIVSFSVDNGATWQNPEELGITASMESGASGSGYYTLPREKVNGKNLLYKWGNICFKGFDKNTVYKVKIVNNSTTQLSFWGFETWSNPRINLVVVAEGGNTATSQKEAPHRFYSEMYNPSLVIYEVPYLNDLGQGSIPNYKGKITVTSTAPASPSNYDFYYCSEDGVYTKFGGLSAKKGEYIEWYNSAWKIGSTQLSTKLANYRNHNTEVFERLAKQGVPILVVITHESTYTTPIPYCAETGMSVIRGLAGKYGFAVVDVNKFQRLNNLLTGVHADGTHLNDKGVKMYMDAISPLFSIPYNDRYCGTGFSIRKPHYGTGTGGTTTSFGFEFSKIPKVMVSGGTNIVVTDITKSGFTTSGSGSFNYMAQIE